MLARRELSEAQVRQRLSRLGYDEQSIDEAVVKLKDERAIDDLRVAEAIARTQSVAKGRGRLRVEREIEAAGIRRSDIGRVIDAVALDDDELIKAAIARRLRGRATPADDAEIRRLYRYLLGQGFEHDRIMRALRSRGVKS
jgi:regulatory protein